MHKYTDRPQPNGKAAVMMLPRVAIERACVAMGKGS